MHYPELLNLSAEELKRALPEAEETMKRAVALYGLADTRTVDANFRRCEIKELLKRDGGRG